MGIGDEARSVGRELPNVKEGRRKLPTRESRRESVFRERSGVSWSMSSSTTAVVVMVAVLEVEKVVVVVVVVGS